MNIKMIGKIQWSIITRKRKGLQLPKYGRYHWYRLNAKTKSLWRFWNKRFRRRSWFVCSKRDVIVSRCILEHSKYVCWTFNIWAWLCSFSYCTWIRIARPKMSLMLEKGITEGICPLFIDTQKQITNIWEIMIKIKNRHILNIGM